MLAQDKLWGFQPPFDFYLFFAFFTTSLVQTDMYIVEAAELSDLEAQWFTLSCDLS